MEKSIYDINYWNKMIRQNSTSAELISRIRWDFVSMVKPKVVLDYGCFPIDTEILMSDFSIKNIQDINIGDEVFTHLGNIKKVKKVFNREYKDTVYELSCTGLLDKVVATKEHPIFVLKRNSFYGNYINRNKRKKMISPEFIPICEIKKKDYVAIKLIEGNIFDEINLKDFVDFDSFRKLKKEYRKKITLEPDLMWFFGLFLAEGSYVKGHDKIVGLQVTLGLHEKELINKTIKVLTEKLEIPFVYERKDKNSVDIKILNKAYALLFLKLFSKGSKNKSIESIILKCKNNLIKNLIKGFFDGDGHLDLHQSKCGNLSCKTISKKLAKQLSFLLNRMGFAHNIYKSCSKQKNHNDIYVIKLSLDATNNLLDRGKLKTNKQTAQITDDYIFIPVKNIITKKVNEDVYNFEVEDDNSYIANGICVHNCGPGWMSAFAPKDIEVDTYDIAPWPQTGINNKFYDLITFWDVIEHIPDLKILEPLLKSTKSIALATPVLPKGKDLKTWRHYKPGEHINLFTKESLQEYFRNFGFRLIKSGYPECDCGVRQDIFSVLFKKKTVVFTNGCFDLIHSGHLELLKKSRAMGDRLVVAINSDDSARSLGKVPPRPINNQEFRVNVLKSIKWVDEVIVFDDLEKAVKDVRPDIIVKGGDYTEDKVVCGDLVKSWGGEVKIIPFVDGNSTTSIINKIRNL